MIQTTSTVIIPSVVRYAALSMRNASRAPTPLRCIQPGTNMLLTTPRRTFLSSTQRKVTLTDPTAHKEATGPHRRALQIFWRRRLYQTIFRGYRSVTVGAHETKCCQYRTNHGTRRLGALPPGLFSRGAESR